MKCFTFRAVWILLILPVFSGENLCKREFLQHFNISTGLQSDVLLQCNFNPALLGSDQTADIAVVWSQNITLNGLVEITLQGDVKFWDYKGGRIKAFPELSKSGNFSILLQNVQPYDLSLYHCELFNGSGCSIAYQEIQLSQKNDQSSLLLWITVGALAGVIVLLVVFTPCFVRAKRRSNTTVTEPDYENNVGAHPDRGKRSIENPIYETSCQPESNNCAREDKELSSDTPVYATVKKVKLAKRT